MPPKALPPLEERFTDYAAIALATSAIEHAAKAAPRSADVDRALQALVDELWAYLYSSQNGQAPAPIGSPVVPEGWPPPTR
jgi:hypothetical protein